METTRRNHYPAHCAWCDTYVPAQRGVWSYGSTYCDATCEADFHQNAVERQRIEIETRRILQQRLIADSLRPESDTTIAKVIGKATAGRHQTLDNLIEATAEDVDAVMQAVAKRDRAKRTRVARAEAKRTNTCRRCGGAGASDRWIATGRICFDCHGTGKDHE